ncbi:MAG: hypothetical protein ABFR97_05145 [Thermodesulfobacteriota bacterium]
MTFLVPLSLFGWLPLAIVFFVLMPARRAALATVVGGVLLLPMAQYDLPGLPEYSKVTAMALGLLIGGLLSGKMAKAEIEWSRYDLPMLLWCFVSPMATSLTNGLGYYDGFAGILSTCLQWGVFYWVGRLYFSDGASLRDICLAIVIGGLIYVPLCLFELRMSPQLSRNIYGFFPHSFVQHVRYGAYRPIVFMQHGLMVSFWMAMAATVAFWLWRDRALSHLRGLPMPLAIVALAVTAIFCRSANAWFFLVVGLGSYYYWRSCNSVRFLRWAIFLIPLYIVARAFNIVSFENVQAVAGMIFDADRVASLAFRLIQEDLFSAKALEQPLFGWGEWGRGWPVDPDTGELVVQAVDALWTIVLSVKGFVGLCSLFAAMLMGPWLVLRAHGRYKERFSEAEQANLVDGVVLSLVVIFFMIDSLLNGMINSVYILCAGALVSYYLHGEKALLAQEAVSEGGKA